MVTLQQRPQLTGNRLPSLPHLRLERHDLGRILDSVGAARHACPAPRPLDLLKLSQRTVHLLPPRAHLQCLGQTCGACCWQACTAVNSQPAAAKKSPGGTPSAAQLGPAAPPHLARGVKVLVGQRALQLAVHLELEQEQHHLRVCVDTKERQGTRWAGGGGKESVRYGAAGPAAAARECERPTRAAGCCGNPIERQRARLTSLLISSERSHVSTSVAGSHCTAESRLARRLPRCECSAARPGQTEE